MIKLDVGCGMAKREGYVGVDIHPDTQADVVAPMWNLPYEADSVDEIYSSHALEHIPQDHVLPTLREWRRVIKPDGLIIIRVPDLMWICREFLNNPVMGWRLATVFGAQTHPGEFHQTGFTEGWMKHHYLPSAGLNLLKFERLWTHEQETMSFECGK
jgi:predicted SAM-dependent methyltransferase